MWRKAIRLIRWTTLTCTCVALSHARMSTQYPSSNDMSSQSLTYDGIVATANIPYSSTAGFPGFRSNERIGTTITTK